MTTTTKTLLAVSIAGFAVGAFTNVLWGIGTPIGAVCFGLFVISKLLEKEVAKFDEEQRLNLQRKAAAPAPAHSDEEHRLAA
jgi:hypothetical protein